MNFTRLVDARDLFDNKTPIDEFDAYVFIFAPNDETADKFNQLVAYLLHTARALCVVVTPNDLALAPVGSSLKKLTDLAAQLKLTRLEHSCAVWIDKSSLLALSEQQIRGGYFDLMSSDDSYVKDQVIRCLREANSASDPTLSQKILDLAKLLIPFVKAGAGHP